MSTAVQSFVEVCAAVIKTHILYVVLAVTESQWEKIAEVFSMVCIFPNCIGALNGKLVHIKVPAHSAPQCFDYKKSLYIVLSALLIHHYKFIARNIASCRKNSNEYIQIGKWTKLWKENCFKFLKINHCL
jgi:hypothetical protein